MNSMQLNSFKQNIFYFLIICFTFINCNNLISEPKSVNKEFENVNKLAKEFLQNMIDKQYEKAHNYFDENVKNLMTIEKLQETHGQLNTAFGVFSQFGDIGNSKMENMKIAEVIMKYEKNNLNTRLVFDTTNKIAGLFFIPTYERTNKNAVTYIDTSRFTEEDVEFGNPDWSIKGSLCIPKYKKSMYAIVMLSGSGPNNRNSEIGPNVPFLDIAQGLASSGIMTLRFDKRTKLYGKKMYETTNSHITLKEEYYDDTDYAIDFISRYADYLKVNLKGLIILGHSQGGSVLPYIMKNSKFKDKISGGIFMAAPARNFEDILLDQYNYLFTLDNVLEQKEQDELNKLKLQIAKVKDLANHKDDKYLPMNLPYEYWVSINECKPIENIKINDKPIFFLQGGKDYQVTLQDLNLFETALANKKNTKFKFYDNLSHIFMQVEGKPNPDMYTQKNNVDPEVIKDIEKWVKSAFKE